MLVIDTNSRTSSQISLMKEKHVTAVGRYYSRKKGKAITPSEASKLINAGFKIFMVFEDSGNPELTFEAGENDAVTAIEQASQIGQPDGSCIYFAMEHLPDGYRKNHLTGIAAYFSGLNAKINRKFKIGVYSNGIVCDALLRAGLCQHAWLSASMAFEGSTAFYDSGRWSLAQRQIDIDWENLSVDINEAKSDFGEFDRLSRAGEAEAPVGQNILKPSTLSPRDVAGISKISNIAQDLAVSPDDRSTNTFMTQGVAGQQRDLENQGDKGPREQSTTSATLFYEQSTGRMLIRVGDSVDTLGVGYSGSRSAGGYNDPSKQCVKKVGPIPRGKYTLGEPGPGPSPYSIRLYPDPSNNMCGRGGFLIHGDSTIHPNDASEGCIILKLSERKAIHESGCKTLIVVDKVSY